VPYEQKNKKEKFISTVDILVLNHAFLPHFSNLCLNIFAFVFVCFLSLSVITNVI